MDQISRNFIDFQSSLRNSKRELNNYLNANPQGVFVYYLAPLSNIQKMLNSNKLSPRNITVDFSDLSDQNIQENREKIVELRNDRYIYKAKIHDCVNFFLNPLNKTYYAFRRNAMIRYHQDPNSAVVGIVEMNLHAMLDREDVAWTVSDGNLAVGNTDNEYQKFKWEDIYSVNLSSDSANYLQDPSRSSEFLIYVDDNGKIGHVDFDSVNRILVLDTDLNNINQDLRDELSIEQINHNRNIFVFGNPLYNDKQFSIELSSLIELIDSNLVITRALRRITRIESELGISLKKSYTNKNQAFNYKHGLGHEIRVMFWILVLGEILVRKNYEIRDEEITAALYAGFFHDLCRQNNAPDQTHGKIASETFSEFIQKKLPPSLANQCINAISCHSLDQDPEKRDVVWVLLKDADALERGRFGKSNTSGGCKSEKLRLMLFKNEPMLAFTLLKASYLLPKLTNYINWSDESCNDFVDTFLSSLQCVCDFYSDQDDNWIKETRKVLSKYKLLYG